MKLERDWVVAGKSQVQASTTNRPVLGAVMQAAAEDYHPLIWFLLFGVRISDAPGATAAARFLRALHFIGGSSLSRTDAKIRANRILEAEATRPLEAWRILRRTLPRGLFETPKRPPICPGGVAENAAVQFRRHHPADHPCPKPEPRDHRRLIRLHRRNLQTV